nr:hypothetical protein [Tanacetum cinerariifolium]
PLPPSLSPPSPKLMIMALEEYGYQSRRGMRVPKKWMSSYSDDVIFLKGDEDSNSTLKNHISHLHCEALKRAVDEAIVYVSRWEYFRGVVNPKNKTHSGVLRDVYVLKDHLDAQERKQDKSTLETSVDFKKEILDAEMQANEAIPLSDEEIALDAASSEGSMSGPVSGGEEAEAEANYGYDVYHDDY